MEFLSQSRRRSSARNVHIGEEQGETDVSAGYVNSRLGHKSMEKNSVRNLQYEPKYRLIRGIYSDYYYLVSSHGFLGLQTGYFSGTR